MKGTSGATLRQGGQAWRWLLPLVALTLLIGALSLWTYRVFSAEIRDEVARTLTGIAEEKHASIEHWLADNETDARIFFTGTSVTLLLLKEWIAGGRRDEAPLNRLRARLEAVARDRGWGGLVLYDDRGEPRVVVGDDGARVSAEQVQDLLRRPRLERLDAQPGADGVWRYGLLAPVGGEDGPPLGVALLTWSLEEALSPTLAAWPVPIRSVDLALIRREGDTVRFLITLGKMSKNLAGEQRSFREWPRLFAVLAAQGQRGIVQGALDYRGVPILGYATDIAGSPWIMLTKMDREEAEAKLRGLAVALTVATLLVLGLLYGTGFGLWRWDRQRRDTIALERELALRRQERQTRQMLDAILDCSIDAIFAKDLQGRYVLANQACATHLGRTVEQLQGRGDSELLPPAVAAPLMAEDRRVLAGESFVNLEQRLALPGGEGTYLVTKAPLRDAEGTIIGLYGISRDISERQRQEAALRAAEATAARLQGEMRWKYALDAGGHGVWDWHVDTGYVDFSPTLIRMLGYDEADFGPDVSEWSRRVHPDDLAATEAALQAHLAGETPGYASVHRLRCKDGGWKWTLDCGAVFERDAAGKPLRMLGTHTDITAQMEAEARLRESEAEIRALNADLEAKVAARTAEARAASAAKSEFLAHMSHEIRTPMNAVLGLVQVMEKSPLPPAQRDLIERIRTAGHSLLLLLNDILDFSKIEAGQLQLEARPFVLTPLLDQLDTLLGATARAKGLRFTTDAAPLPDGALVGDPLRLEQILTNLIGNAIKFTDQGEVRLSIRPLEQADDNARLRFEITDTGIGIAPAVLPHLFDAFKQADTGIGRRFGGTGLGLAISKRLVDLMGGTLGVDSQEGLGSTFWCELPFPRTAGVPELSVAPTATGPVTPGPRLAGRHYLIVDDNAFNLEVLERMLALEGARATRAGDGREALARLKTQADAFDAVLMDVQMPVLDGLSATRALRGELGLTHLPVIAVTAGVLKAEQQRAHEAGVDEVLPKPVDLDRLVAVLSRWAPRVATGAAGEVAALATPSAPGKGVPAAVPQGPSEWAVAALPDIAGIDQTHVAQLIDGDLAFYQQLLSGLVAAARDVPAQVRSALAQGAVTDAAARLHRLRGALSNLGALELAGRIQGLEVALEEATAAGHAEEALGTAGSAVQERLAEVEADLGRLLASAEAWLAAAPAEPIPRVAPSAARLNAPHVLVVDDAPTNVEVLLKILDEDYNVCLATSGAEALDLLAQGERPELILLDVMMPGMDGYQLCARLKADPLTRDIPVIFVTARTDAESETRALAAGGVDFLHKPVNAAVVRARVRLQLALRGQTQELQGRLTEIAQAHEQLQVLWQAVEQSPTSIVITDREANIKYVNPHFSRETGYEAAEVQGQNPRLLQSGLTDPAVFRAMWERLADGEPWGGELINRRKNGATFWEEAHIAPVRDARGAITHYVGVNLNITARREAHERLAYMANHDVLTDLPNRVLFFERLEQAMALARRHGTRLALLFVDLDKFKPINDTWGHAVGDQLLQAVARRLTGRLRDADTVGRIGGDEFVILLHQVGDAGYAAQVADELRLSLAQPFVLAGQTLTLSASIGVALFPDHGQDAIELARHADDSMYQAKQAGGDGLRLFAG